MLGFGLGPSQWLHGSSQWGIWEAGPPDGSNIVCTEIKIYTSNSFLYSAFYNFMYTFKGFSKIHQPFPDTVCSKITKFNYVYEN